MLNKLLKMMKLTNVIHFIFAFYSCSEQVKMNRKPLKLNEILPVKIKNDLKSIQSLNPAWIKYYTSKISNFRIDQFVLKGETKASELINGNIYGDYDKEFNKNHSQFLINSKDNSQYIDLDSYQMTIEKNNKGELICSGVEIDQEINWVNRKTKEIKRIFFASSSTYIDDAIWMNNNKVALLGVTENKLFIEIIDLETLRYKTYIYPTIISKSFNFSSEVRLKKVKIGE